MREGEDLGPVGFAGTVDNHAFDAVLRADGEQFRLASGEAVVLQMIVGVVKIHRGGEHGRLAGANQPGTLAARAG